MFKINGQRVGSFSFTKTGKKHERIHWILSSLAMKAVYLTIFWPNDDANIWSQGCMADRWVIYTKKVVLDVCMDLLMFLSPWNLALCVIIVIIFTWSYLVLVSSLLSFTSQRESQFGCDSCQWKARNSGPRFLLRSPCGRLGGSDSLGTFPAETLQRWKMHSLYHSYLRHSDLF